LESEPRRQIERLYHAALELEGGERLAFLEQACKHAGLRREGEALLEGDAKAGSFIESPVIEEAAQQQADASANRMTQPQRARGSPTADRELLTWDGLGSRPLKTAV
jgi:hypothetical protein